jgi:hypothetical protein
MTLYLRPTGEALFSLLLRCIHSGPGSFLRKSPKMKRLHLLLLHPSTWSSIGITEPSRPLSWKAVCNGSTFIFEFLSQNDGYSYDLSIGTPPMPGLLINTSFSKLSKHFQTMFPKATFLNLPEQPRLIV